MTAEGADGTLNLPQRNETEQKNKSQCGNTSKQAKRKGISKAGQTVDHRADLLIQRAVFKPELPHLNGGVTDQPAAAEG
jgi:hypothetical protein